MQLVIRHLVVPSICRTTPQIIMTLPYILVPNNRLWPLKTDELIMCIQSLKSGQHGNFQFTRITDRFKWYLCPPKCITLLDKTASARGFIVFSFFGLLGLAYSSNGENGKRDKLEMQNNTRVNTYTRL